jgi:hypothetical protein
MRYALHELWLTAQIAESLRMNANADPIAIARIADILAKNKNSGQKVLLSRFRLKK